FDGPELRARPVDAPRELDVLRQAIGPRQARPVEEAVVLQQRRVTRGRREPQRGVVGAREEVIVSESTTAFSSRCGAAERVDAARGNGAEHALMGETTVLIQLQRELVLAAVH